MSNKLRDAAASLRAAYDGGAIPPLRDCILATDAEGAYAIQAHNTAYWMANGRALVGRKIGLTAKAVQAQLGVDQPDYGALFADMRIESGGTLVSSRVLQPKAEAEIAIILKSDVTDPTVDAAAMLRATDFVCPAIEIVDSRIADWKITFADTVADNGSSAFFVLGDQQCAPDDVDLYTCGMVMEINGQIASLGAGAACLGHPFNAAAWLAQVMIEQGTPLKAGDIVLTGALGPMVALNEGDHVEAKIGGIGSCSFKYMGARQ